MNSIEFIIGIPSYIFDDVKVLPYIPEIHHKGFQKLLAVAKEGRRGEGLAVGK